jgi:hypothetical protein
MGVSYLNKNVQMELWVLDGGWTMRGPSNRIKSIRALLASLPR